MTIRDYLFVSPTGYVFYIPPIDIRADLKLDTNAVPPQTTTDPLAYNKIVWIDNDNHTVYHYDDKGILNDWSMSDLHQISDQEVRKALEYRLPNKMHGNKKNSGLITEDENGNMVRFEHMADSSREHDFGETEFHPKPETVGNLSSGHGTPVFEYANNSRLRQFADNWIKKTEQQFDPSRQATIDQFNLYTCGDSTAKMFVALKVAQAEAANYPKFVKEYHEAYREFSEADINDAPRIPHVNTKFFPHQAIALAKLKKSKRMLLGVAAGGGKTLLSLSDILYHVMNGDIKRGAVIMPDHLLGQQKAEILKFTNNTVNVICISNWIVSQNCTKKSDDLYNLAPLEKLISSAPPNTVVLVSYEFFTAEHFPVAGKGIHFPRVPWLIKKCGVDMVTLDESHKIKNASMISKAILQLSPLVKWRRAMSGTIVSNNPKDVFRQASFVDPSVLGDEDDFLDRYAESYNRAGLVKKWKPGAIKALRKDLSQIAIQMSRPNWMYMLPKFNRTYHNIELSSTHMAIYKKIIEEIITEIENDPKLKEAWEKFKALPPEEQDQDEFKPLITRLARFERFLGCPMTEKFAAMLPKEDRISGKLSKMDEILDKHFAHDWPDNRGKVIVYSQFVDVVMHAWQNSKYHDVGRIYYSKDKHGLAEFKTDPKVKILFASENSLREGHNLQVANKIIRLGMPWNPGDLDQTNARIYRAGQHAEHPEVDLDVLVADDTAEVTKVARLITKVHLNTKLLTDYDDPAHLDPIFMNLENMTQFNKFSDLQPYISLEDRILKFEESEGEKIKLRQGMEKVELASNLQIKGSIQIDTPFIPGDDKVKVGKKEKPAKLNPTEHAGDPEHGTIADLEWNLININKTNVLIAYQKSNTLSRMRRIGFYFDNNYWVIRTRSAQVAIYVMKMLESMGVQIKQMSKKIKWAEANMPAGAEIEMPSRKKKPFATVDGDVIRIDGKWYFHITAPEATPQVRARLRNIRVKGEPFRLIRMSGYSYAGVNSGIVLKLMKKAKDQGFGVANMEKFTERLDDKMPGLSNKVRELFTK